MHVCVTGHRPRSICLPKLGNPYDWNHPTAQEVRAWFNFQLSLLRSKLASKEELIGASGLALGADQWAAAVYNQLGINWVGFAPCKNQDRFWKDPSKEVYKDLYASAKEVRYTFDGSYPGPWVMQKRNEDMKAFISGGGTLLAIWTGVRSGGTWNMIQSCRKDPSIDIIYFNPLSETG